MTTNGNGDTIPNGRTAIKVDLLWKLVVVGGLALAAKLSWNAWDQSQETQRLQTKALEELTRVTAVLDNRVTTIEMMSSERGRLLNDLLIRLADRLDPPLSK